MSRQEQQITVPSEPDFGKLYKKGILAFTRKTHAANPGVQIDRNTMATLWCNTARDLHPNWQTTKYSTAQKDNFLRLVLLAPKSSNRKLQDYWREREQPDYVEENAVEEMLDLMEESKANQKKLA